jgi:flavin reductase (DIM6/NTAB) family NADH-FMN oxidoreductase RutF
MTAGATSRACTDDYRDMMSAFPTGVAVVTSTDTDGRPRGLTCSSLSSVTLRPPTLLVCIATGSSTLAAILSSEAFAVNLLHSRGRNAAVVFSAAVADRFAEVTWHSAGPGGPPHLIEDAFAVADCRVAGVTKVGDHAVVLGEVERVTHTPDRPLLYGLRRFSSWRPQGSLEQAWNSPSSVP